MASIVLPLPSETATWPGLPAFFLRMKKAPGIFFAWLMAISWPLDLASASQEPEIAPLIDLDTRYYAQLQCPANRLRNRLWR